MERKKYSLFKTRKGFVLGEEECKPIFKDIGFDFPDDHKFRSLTEVLNFAIENSWEKGITPVFYLQSYIKNIPIIDGLDWNLSEKHLFYRINREYESLAKVIHGINEIGRAHV